MTEPFFDNDAFHDFRTRANKAVVFNDGRVSLQRPPVRRRTHAAGKQNILPIPAQEPTVARVSTIMPSST